MKRGEKFISWYPSISDCQHQWNAPSNPKPTRTRTCNRVRTAAMITVRQDVVLKPRKINFTRASIMWMISTVAMSGNSSLTSVYAIAPPKTKNAWLIIAFLIGPINQFISEYEQIILQATIKHLQPKGGAGIWKGGTMVGVHSCRLYGDFQPSDTTKIFQLKPSASATRWELISDGLLTHKGHWRYDCPINLIIFVLFTFWANF